MPSTNEHGLRFLEEVRAIYSDCSKLLTPNSAARLTAFAICVMLDGSGEHVGPNYELYVRTENSDLEPVTFFHHEL